MLIDLEGFSRTPSGYQATFTNLASGAPSTMSGILSVSGSLDYVLDSHSFSFTTTAYTTSSLSGNDLLVDSGNITQITKNGTTEWGVSGGATGNHIDGDEALTFSFDLSGLGGYPLQITEVVISETTATAAAQFILDGVSTTSLVNGVNDLSGLSLNLLDGSLIAFRETGGSGGDFRVDSFTVTAVPEPSTYALFAGGLMLLAVGALRRRRR